MSYLPKKKKSTYRNPDYSGADKLRATSEWRKLSKYKLSLDPLCENCLREDRTTIAKHAHHILSVEKRPDLCFTLENLMSVCVACHNLLDKGKNK